MSDQLRGSELLAGLKPQQHQLLGRRKISVTAEPRTRLPTAGTLAARSPSQDEPSTARGESQVRRCAQLRGTLPQQLAQSNSSFLLAPLHT